MNRLASRLFLALCFFCLLPAPRTATASCPPSQLFQPYVNQTIGSSPFTVLTVDTDRDGILDLVVVDNGSQALSVALGNGNGTFRTPNLFTVGRGPGQVTAADFNGDSLVDFAVNSSGSDAVYVLTGHGDGTFTATAYPAGSTPYGVTHGDFNGDGLQDIAVASFLGNGTSVLLRLPLGGFAAPVIYPAGLHPYFITTGDFNHDGIVDLAVTNQDSYDVTILIGNGAGGLGDGTFAPGVSYPVGLYPYSAATGDFNHDGITDLAVANAGSGTISVLRGNGTAGVGDGTFALAVNYSSGPQPRSVVAGDVDGDGIADLAVADYSGNVSVLLGLGSGGVGNGAFASPLLFAAGYTGTGIALGDLNRDGLPDLVVANYESNVVTILLHGCGAPPPPPPNHAPTLTRVRDVPADQGGRVFVTWTRSSLDTAGTATITGYRVWRRIMPETAMAAALADGDAHADLDHVRLRMLYAGNPGDSAAVTYWEALVTLPAEALEGYGYTAPTTRDSLPDGNPYTAFFVTALTANPAVFFESNIDSGYSVDNLSPASPPAANAVYGSGVALHWSPNSEADLAGYRIYRGPASSTSAVTLNLIATRADTGFVDPSGNLSYAYGLSSFDVHGNESVRVLLSPPLPTATAISLMSSEVETGLVHLVWYGDGNSASQATVYRCTSSGAWSAIGETVADGNGRLEFSDPSVAAGTRYGYRLGVTKAGVESMTGEVWVNTPALALALALRGVTPNPSRNGRLSLSCTLPTAGTVKFDVIDLSGRRVMTRSLGALDAGPHVLDLTRESKLPGGVYVIRLSQSGRSISTKAVVLE